MQKSTFIKSIYFMPILLMPYGITAQLQLANSLMPNSKTIEVVMKPSQYGDFPDTLTSSAATVIYKITDQQAYKIYSRPSDLDVGSKQIELTETDWAAGIYWLRVFEETSSDSQKFTVH